MSVWTYVGQIVNFLAFVAILYLLLYKPLGRVMQRRKEEMEAELRDAEKKLQEAEKIRAEVEQREKELEEKRESTLKEARERADAHRKEVLQKAEEQGRGRLDRFRRIMEQERSQVLDQITEELRDTIVRVAGSALKDASGEIGDRALKRVQALLEEMSKDEIQGAREALQELENRVPVRSASPLTDDQIDRLRKLLSEKLSVKKIELEIEEDPSLLAGLELTLGHIHLQAHWRGVIDEALQDQQKPKKGPTGEGKEGKEKRAEEKEKPEEQQAKQVAKPESKGPEEEEEEPEPERKRRKDT